MYNHNLIEKKWQKYWKENQTFKFTDRSNAKKFYVLDMFPYPSGKGLHVGHPKGYTATDVISRYKRLKGFDVLHPIGWDAFGLPAEQYAIDTNNHPSDFTEDNINKFREQLISIGFDYDYQKEVNTTDPRYYKWTQWIFTQLYKNGLAEIQNINVNWCENLKTTLSNEEVLIDQNGNQVSERGSHPVIQKPMKQWVLKITSYADKLIDGLNDLDWPESLKNHQLNWIGRTKGFEITFKNQKSKIKAFAIKKDILNSADCLLVSPSYTKLNDEFDLSEEMIFFVNEFNKKNKRNLIIEKNFDCISLKTSFVNPINGKILPVYLTNYVFNNSDKYVYIVSSTTNDYDKKIINLNKIKTNDITSVTDYAGFDEIIIPKTTYKLKDWVFSRQRYWGEPFPILFNDKNEIIIENKLPLLLPECQDFKPNDNGESPLARIDSFINVTLNGKKYRRDSNTMPQWAGSCWYYLGYILKNADDSYVDLNSSEAYKRFEKWLPVDIYIGGQEHAVLHLLYARFWHRFLYDIKIVPTKEPFYKIINQGMILGENGEKMSKSKGNVISPNDIIKDYGADALRLYESFMGPITATLPWKEEGITGVRKWLDRVWRYFNEIEKSIVDEKECSDILVYEYNLFVKNFEFNLENQNFNLAISDMMIFVNVLYKEKKVTQHYLDSFLIMLSCFAPHLSEELWSKNNKTSVCLQQFPKYDISKTVSSQLNIPFQINGKTKLILKIPKDLSEKEMIEVVKQNVKVKLLLENKKVKKQIIVINKIINYLVE